MAYVVSKKLDCRWLYDPLPIIRLSRAVRQLNSGEIIEMISNDPAALYDMKAWSKLTGHTVLETTKRPYHTCFLIQKKI